MQSRFITELTIIKEKNPAKPLSELVRFLFHGVRTGLDPKQIAMSEAGLDMRYASPAGLYGSGIYFADNSAYSVAYCGDKVNGRK